MDWCDDAAKQRKTRNMGFQCLTGFLIKDTFAQDLVKASLSNPYIFVHHLASLNDIQFLGQASMSSCINNWYNKDPIERRQQSEDVKSP